MNQRISPVLDFAWQLNHNHAVDDAAYGRAARDLGDAGLVDMVMLVGLYLQVCATINAFDVPGAPPGRPASGRRRGRYP